MKRRRISSKNALKAAFAAVCVMILCVLPVFGGENPKISVGKVTASPGETVSVPVDVSGSPGVCGATISVSYDNALTLKSITKGSAWSSLTMTKPGNLSKKTVNLVWDGMEADASNGKVALLEFTAPDAPGKYDVNVSYRAGDIVDGNLSPVSFETENGYIEVERSATVTVGISDKNIQLKGKNLEGSILISFYRGNKLISVRFYSAGENINVDSVPLQAIRAKVMWWTDLTSFKPVCAAQEIYFD